MHSQRVAPTPPACKKVLPARTFGACTAAATATSSCTRTRWPVLEYYADEVTNYAATEWTVAPPQASVQPDTVPLDAVLQLVALPDLILT